MKRYEPIRFYGLFVYVYCLLTVVEGMRCYSCWYDSQYNTDKEWNRIACIDEPETIPGINYINCNETKYCVTDELYDLVSEEILTYSRSCSATPRSNKCQLETNRLRCSRSCQRQHCNGIKQGHMYEKFLSASRAGWSSSQTNMWRTLAIVACIGLFV